MVQYYKFIELLDQNQDENLRQFVELRVECVIWKVSEPEWELDTSLENWMFCNLKVSEPRWELETSWRTDSEIYSIYF
jgi:hypothetical protein